MGKMMQCKGILRECALAFVILIGCREIRAEMQLGTNLMELFWYNGYRDYFVEGVNWATVTNPWKPELIRDLKAGYTVIRFMEWGGVCSDNGDPPIRSKWSERTPKTANHYTVKIAAYE